MVAIGLLVYMCAGLATGYTYLPGKRGGFLLSAIPTFMMVGAASAAFLAAVLMIVDHYDRRPNEGTYQLARRYCLRIALYLFIAAPFIETAQRILLFFDIDVFPHLHGLAERYTFYSPELSPLARHLDPIVSNGALIFVLSMLVTGLGVLISKFSSGLKRLTAVLMALGMLALSTLLLAKSTQEFLSGEVKGGRRYSRYVVRAVEEPAKFNAILLSQFGLFGVIFTGSAFVLVGTAIGRLKH